MKLIILVFLLITASCTEPNKNTVTLINSKQVYGMFTSSEYPYQPFTSGDTVWVTVEWFGSLHTVHTVLVPNEVVACDSTDINVNYFKAVVN